MPAGWWWSAAGDRPAVGPPAAARRACAGASAAELLRLTLWVCGPLAVGYGAGWPLPAQMAQPGDVAPGIALRASPLAEWEVNGKEAFMEYDLQGGGSPREGPSMELLLSKSQN